LFGGSLDFLIGIMGEREVFDLEKINFDFFLINFFFEKIDFKNFNLI